MSYTGKYALARHETLALKCEDLERQLNEARTYTTDYGFELGRKKEELAEAKQNIYKFSELALIEGISFGYSWEDFKLYVLDKQLKEKGDE